MDVADVYQPNVCVGPRTARLLKTRSIMQEAPPGPMRSGPPVVTRAGVVAWPIESIAPVNPSSYGRPTSKLIAAPVRFTNDSRLHHM